MTPKMRHFKIENGKATIDKDGEFLHINDIVLLTTPCPSLLREGSKNLEA